eukprot:4636408-Amphidinium_carterae.1
MDSPVRNVPPKCRRCSPAQRPLHDRCHKMCASRRVKSASTNDMRHECLPAEQDHVAVKMDDKP